MHVDAFLEGAGGLKDTPAGRRKYEQYLGWLSESDEAQREARFASMSRGWAIGARAFKRAVIEDERERLAELELGSKEYSDLRVEMWEAELERCLRALGKSESDLTADAKSADWKVAIAARLKRKLLCKNPWIGSRLNMGASAAISRYCGELRDGGRQSARARLERLDK